MKTKINPIDDAVMVWIPAGDFLMGSKNDGTLGSDKEAYDGEKPQRMVYLSGYWMYKYPVTVGQYENFCNATGRKMSPAPSFNSDWSEKDQPMVNVSWEEAKAYCDWAKVALPTEAQWEKAARGTDGRIYPWGNSFDDTKLWCSVKTYRSTQKTRPGTASVYRSENVCESSFGCVDMAGNVWQWCADWYQADYYKTAPLRDPAGPSTGTWRVLRGGSWLGSDTSALRSADRGRVIPTDGCNYWGFRAASELP